MPTRTELIPCVTCGQPRLIVVRRGADRRRALNRPCKRCGQHARQPPRTNGPTVDVTCPRCHQPRPILTHGQVALNKAQTRLCRKCTNETMRRVNTPRQEPDDLVVELLIAGTKVKANPAERYAAVAYLTQRKLTTKAIADRLHCTTRTVERHRAKLAAA